MVADSAQYLEIPLLSPVWWEPHNASTPCAHGDELGQEIWARVPMLVVAVWELRH